MWAVLKGVFQTVGLAYLWAKWRERKQIEKTVKQDVALQTREEEARRFHESKKTEQEVLRMDESEVQKELKNEWSRK